MDTCWNAVFTIELGVIAVCSVAIMVCAIKYVWCARQRKTDKSSKHEDGKQPKETNPPDSEKSDKQKGISKKITDSNKTYTWLWILIASIVGAIIFILAMFFFQKWFGFEVSYENSATIVLAFVGIAATFIVVSNYAQVKEVKDEFEKKTKEIKVELENDVKENEGKMTNIIDGIDSLLNGLNCYYEGEQSYETAISHYICALEYFDKAGKEIYIMSTWWYILNIPLSDTVIETTKNNKDRLISLIGKYPGAITRDMLTFANKMKIKDHIPAHKNK